MNLRAYLFLLLAWPVMASAQMPQLNAADIASGLQKLGVKGSVLYIAAHPDDENTRLLAYLAKEVKVRTGYLSLTRGDGGQNLIGNEQAELLGLIRTQELLAARRTDGAEQFFTRANDFGFSKTSDEAFQIWGKEQILADVVWTIRKFQPDVIITRFPEDSRAGHGHHSGSAILAHEAFSAAADPKRFPEQLKYVKPWQAKRILWNTFNFGSTNTTAPDQLKIDVGLFNPLVGKSYGEIAAISRTNHKSQGFGSTLQRGEALEYFSHTAGEPAKTDLFDGINIKVQDKAIVDALDQIQKNYQVDAPYKSLPDLLKLRKSTAGKTFNHALLDELILACAGFWADANTTENAYAVGDSIMVNYNAIYRNNTSLPIKLTINTANQGSRQLQFNKISNLSFKLATSNDDITQPYWLAENHQIGQYHIASQEDVGYPENRKRMSISAAIDIDGEKINWITPVTFKSTDPIRGEVYQNLVIAPSVTATLSEKAYLFIGNTPQTISVQLKSFKNNNTGTIKPQLPAGWKSNPQAINFKLDKKGDEQLISFTITPESSTTSGQLLLQVNNNTGKGLKTIGYEHIPNITIFPEASARLEKVDLKIVGKRIAYIDGAGDLVADALKQIGYEVTHLNTAQVLSSDLSGYDAIVTGVRLYNINDDAKTLQPKLMAYVQNGGTLVAQYNVNTNLKLSNLGPYPFKLANKRVTDENAPVKFIAPNHPALNYPNKIAAKDFEGWVQERGIYFATDIDPKYATILSMNDPGESASDGSLLVADYGKGKFVYTSLVFFRELPAGVPGAYRLFANLLAPKQP